VVKKAKRWETAQNYEREYWRRIAENIAADSKKQLTWYSWKASEFKKKLEDVNLCFNKENCRILEIGSGPIGIVSYLQWGEKFAIDPLNDFYKANPNLVAVRNGEVHYVSGTGEQLPYSDGFFNVVIIDNVLDHVQSPGVVLEQIYRVLSLEGLLYIELNIHTLWGFVLHSALAKLKIDKGHPHSYTSKKIKYTLEQYGFKVITESVKDYKEARTLDRKSVSLRSKLKGYSGLSEFIYSTVCRKI
jgi:ubiquinone/menaquinone biosynthesis C-methylase UbiE